MIAIRPRPTTAVNRVLSTDPTATTPSTATLMRTQPGPSVQAIAASAAQTNTLGTSAPALARARRANPIVTSIAKMPTGEITSQVGALPRTRSTVANDSTSRPTRAAAIISSSRDRRSVSASGAPVTENTDRTTRERTTRTRR